MLFTSAQYLLFLPAVVLLFWVLPKKVRLPMLLLASYLFYMCWMPVFVFLIFGMTVFNWILGNILHNAQNSKKTIFVLGVAANLLCLGIFKYSGLVVQTADSLVGVITHHNPGWVVNIILPLAISFFIFEFIHYLFEIYRGNKPIESFVLFALFAAFFPTQIAGPIKRYPDFAAQMQEEKAFKLGYLDEGIVLIIIGFAKKVLLADNLATFVDMGYKVPGSFGAPEMWLFAYAFAFQIYFDFSGYTDIARGSARLFGYKIPINFDLPYIASNMSNFWHRWHISLSSWLRDYLFIPLGGSRVSHWQTNRNLLLTMTLGGLWHGASWNFMVWGIFHGLALIVHRQFVGWKNSLKEGAFSQFFQTKLFNLLSIILTFHVVCIGWVFFRIQHIGTALNVVKKMVLFSPIFSGGEAHQFLVLQRHLPIVVLLCVCMVIVLLITNLPISILQEKGFLKKTPPFLKGAFCAFLVLAMVTFLPDGNQPFIYFQF